MKPGPPDAGAADSVLMRQSCHVRKDILVTLMVTSMSTKLSLQTRPKKPWLCSNQLNHLHHRSL